MNRSKIIYIVFCLLFSYSVSKAIDLKSTVSKLKLNDTTESAIVDGPVKVKLISSQFSFTEGPTSNKKGDIYFTDQPNDRIWKYDTKGELSIFMEKAGRSNGMIFDNKDNLLSCADEKNELWLIKPDRKIRILVSDLQGKKMNGPNDVWFDPKQKNIYLTDPYYQRPWWNRKQIELDGQKLYFLKKGSKTPVAVDAEYKQPNGIVGTPDGKILYVADIGDNKTYRYEIAKGGALKNKTLFVNQGSDGMTVDSQGNVYLTGKGVTVYNAKGEKIEQIDVPESWTANVCFGGKDKKTLFITASKSVYVLPMKVKGYK